MNKEKFSELIDKYKQLIESDNNTGEIYKWEAVKCFQDNWDVDAPDFFEMLKKSFAKRENLIYKISYGFITKAAQYFPENVRTIFKNLFNEKIELETRFIKFKQDSEALLPQVIEKFGKELNHQQDERTLAFYLAMRFPEKYPLYKDNIYKALLEIQDSEPKKQAGKKFFHFLEMTNQLLPLIESDKELMNDVKKTLNKDCFQGEQKFLVFQDILWRTINRTQYFIGACIWGPGQDIDKTKEFLENGFWQTDYGVDSTQGQRIYKLLEEVNEGDYIATRYLAKGQSIATITGIGEVVSTEEIDDGVLKVNWLENIPLYKGTIPKGTGAGNWWETLIRLKRKEDVDLIFSPIIKPSINGHSPMNNSSLSETKNIIFYGPPGTGKTYSTTARAIKITNPGFSFPEDSYSDKGRKLIKDEYQRLVNDGRIAFITFHQSLSYEDFIEGIKPLEPKIEGHPVVYKVRPGILKEICDRIKSVEKLIENRQPIHQTITTYDQLFSAFLERLNEIIADLKESNENHYFPSRNSKVRLISIENDNIITQGETAASYETVMKEKLERIYNRFKSADEITNIVKQLREVGTDIGWTTNYFAVFKALKEFESSVKPKNNFIVSDQSQNYVLIIDEINRGNVSQIFGELITLIEDDKRLGNKEALEVTLAYSKEKFGVPQNLHIIGTMNTADRSIEALDTALRRRFSFEFVPPDSNKIINKLSKINLQEIFIQINKRITYLIDEDHQIGHSYFMNLENTNDLKAAFKNKIIPLLKEYFYNDYGKIRMILGAKFVEKREGNNAVPKFAANDEDFIIQKPVYQIIEIDDEFDIEAALKETLHHA